MIGCMSPRIPPTIETSRLLLRAWTRHDLKAHAEMSADPVAMRYIGDGGRRSIKARAGVKSRCTSAIGCSEATVSGRWSGRRTASGSVRLGFWNPPGWPGLEVGWKLSRHAWGEGYATEAGQAAIEWAWRTLDTPELISVIQPGNTASIRVAERLGMRRFRESTVKGQDVVIFGIDRP
jgi:RimJ/RimL family protein N-acetyltransferase